MAAPLVAAGRAIGAIFIGSSQARHYEADLSLIVSLARQAAQALDRALLFERERASAGRLRKLQAVTAALSQAVTLRDVSRTCLEHATRVVDARAGVVVLRGHELGRRRGRADRGYRHRARGAGRRDPRGCRRPDRVVPEERPAHVVRRRLDRVPARERSAGRAASPRTVCWPMRTANGC